MAFVKPRNILHRNTQEDENSELLTLQSGNQEEPLCKKVPKIRKEKKKTNKETQEDPKWCLANKVRNHLTFVFFIKNE